MHSHSCIQFLCSQLIYEKLPPSFLPKSTLDFDFYMVSGVFFCCEEKVEILAAWSKTLLDLVYVKHSRRAQYRGAWLWPICVIASLLC